MQWNGKRRAVVGLDHAEADLAVELDDRAVPEVAGQRHGTILEIISSSRSVAPASRSAGMTRLIVRFSTTVSTA